MELTEISGNIRLYFKDFTFGMPVCAEATHTAMLDSDSECSFERICPQYFRVLNTAITLQDVGKAFDLYFSVTGNWLSDPPYAEPRSLYYCHVQGWNKHLALELLLPGTEVLIRKECFSSETDISKALHFAFGGFIYTCLDFSIKEIDLTDPYITEALEMYCLSKDKQLLLNELFQAH